MVKFTFQRMFGLMKKKFFTLVFVLTLLILCTFLRYSQIHKGYKCLCSSGKVYISKDIWFNEEEILYTCLCANTPNTVKDLE